MNKGSNFQLVVLAFFGVILVAGVLLFAGFGGGGGLGGAGRGATLTLWGTVPDSVMAPLLNTFSQEYQDSIGQVLYEEKRADSFESDLVNALASGKGPDMVIIPQGLLVRQADKLLPLSYEQFTQRKYLDAYTDGSDIFLTNNGILALPLSVDPVVLYWNKQLFSGAGLTSPPRFWDELLTLPEKLVVKDVRGTISQAAISLGGYRNVTRAKETLSSLFLQVGDSITEPVFSEAGLGVNPVLGDSAARGAGPAESALRFYVQFADPAKAVYSWNSALPQSRDLFARGSLAMYVGVASDLAAIQSANPHLSFDVAPLPQVRPVSGGQPNARVYGNYGALAVLRAGKNPALSMQAAFLLSTTNYAEAYARALGLAPARRDLLSQNTSGNALRAVVFKAALNAHGWLDPSPLGTDAIFRSMVESLVSGGITERQALSEARADMSALGQQR
ncbi:MAG: extracellular solute-binding protein [Patescibacteria group bacterium]